MIDYTARMYGLSQYDAAKKLIEDFGLHVQTEAMSREERQRLRREKEERMRIIQIKKRFYRWCEETIELLKMRWYRLKIVDRFFMASHRM